MDKNKRVVMRMHSFKNPPRTTKMLSYLRKEEEAKEKSNIICDFCEASHVSNGYHLNPNFDICSNCYKKLCRHDISLKDMQTLMTKCVEGLTPFST